MLCLSEMKQYFVDNANLSNALPLNPRKLLIAHTSYTKEFISMFANSLTSPLNLDIQVKLLWHKDGTTTASTLFFLFHEIHFNEHWEVGTKEALPFVTKTEQ